MFSSSSKLGHGHFLTSWIRDSETNYRSSTHAGEDKGCLNAQDHDPRGAGNDFYTGGELLAEVPEDVGSGGGGGGEMFPDIDPALLDNADDFDDEENQGRRKWWEVVLFWRWKRKSRSAQVMPISTLQDAAGKEEPRHSFTSAKAKPSAVCEPSLASPVSSQRGATRDSVFVTKRNASVRLDLSSTSWAIPFSMS